MAREGFGDGQIENTELHAAGNIHAHGIRNNRAFGGKHTANRQPIPEVRVGH